MSAAGPTSSVAELGGRAGRGRPPSGRPGRGRRGPGDASGQATVELALVFPIICGLLLLAIEVGSVLRSQVLLVQLTRQVARDASLSPGAAPVDGRAAARAAGLDPGRLQLDVGSATDDGVITVHASYRQPLAVPLVGILHRDVTLGAQLSVRAEEHTAPEEP
jgi:TadE-like protein